MHVASNRTRTGGRLGVLIHNPAVPTGYLEAQSLKRTRGFSDPHRRQERRRGYFSICKFGNACFSSVIAASVIWV